LTTSETSMLVTVRASQEPFVTANCAWKSAPQVYEEGPVTVSDTAPEMHTDVVAVTVPAAFVAESVNVVAVVTDAVVLPVVVGDTAPMPWLMERDVAPVTLQASSTVPPPVGRLAGVAVKLVIWGSVPPPPLLHPHKESPAMSIHVGSLPM
jgi:hypothetical protein